MVVDRFQLIFLKSDENILHFPDFFKLQMDATNLLSSYIDLIILQ